MHLVPTRTRSGGGGFGFEPELSTARGPPVTQACTNPLRSQESFPCHLWNLRWGTPGVEQFSTWMRGVERRLETLPGVLSASLEGDLDRAAEVRLLVEEDPPASEILEAVRAALGRDRMIEDGT